jgi:hypothetical protein
VKAFGASSETAKYILFLLKNRLTFGYIKLTFMQFNLYSRTCPGPVAFCQPLVPVSGPSLCLSSRISVTLCQLFS